MAAIDSGVISPFIPKLLVRTPYRRTVGIQDNLNKGNSLHTASLYSLPLSREELSVLYKLRDEGWSPIRLTEAYAELSDVAREIRELEPAAAYLRLLSNGFGVEVLDANMKVLHGEGDVEDDSHGIAGEIMQIVDDSEFRVAHRCGAHARGVFISKFSLNVADRTPLIDLNRALTPDLAHLVLYGNDSKLLAEVLHHASWPGEVTYDEELEYLGFTFQPLSGASPVALGVDLDGYPAGALLSADGSSQSEVVRYRDWVHPAEIVRDLRNRHR